MVLLVSRGPDPAPALRRLRAEGCGASVREVSERRNVVSATLPETEASQIVAVLRAEGRVAVVRPSGGGHLAAWLNHTRPIAISDRLWVCFPWSELDRRGAPTLVEIDPGRAFGTGSHPTTVLLLRELADRLVPGDTLLDVGCGSGVLAVCAAVLGASAVTALDVRADALAVTRANAAWNNVDPVITTTAAAVESLDAIFDAVVANIDAATLIALAPAIASRLRPGGWIGLSGISPAQVSVVSSAYRAAGPADVDQLDDWASLVHAYPVQS